jgi:hypothetical protein
MELWPTGNLESTNQSSKITYGKNCFQVPYVPFILGSCTHGDPIKSSTYHTPTFQRDTIHSNSIASWPTDIDPAPILSSSLRFLLILVRLSFRSSQRHTPLHLNLSQQLVYINSC